MDVKPPSGADMYDSLAAVYDISGQSRFSLKMIGYLLEMLALRRIKPIRIADLACGTGAAAVALARRKFRVTGIDGSQAMLARARARAERWKVDVNWLQADLADLPERWPGFPEGGFDLVTCLYDSLNHLTVPTDLRRALMGVRRILAPGGLFFFDVNTPHAYASVWGNAEDSHLADNYARFWRSRYDGASGLATLHATYFVPEAADPAIWRRLDITHTARGYDDATVRALLAEAGFELLEAYEAQGFTPVGPETYRAAYLTRA